MQTQKKKEEMQGARLEQLKKQINDERCLDKEGQDEQLHSLQERLAEQEQVFTKKLEIMQNQLNRHMESQKQNSKDMGACVENYQLQAEQMFESIEKSVKDQQ